jgi:hypothetical protein
MSVFALFHDIFRNIFAVAEEHRRNRTGGHLLAF